MYSSKLIGTIDKYLDVEPDVNLAVSLTINKMSVGIVYNLLLLSIFIYEESEDIIVGLETLTSDEKSICLLGLSSNPSWYLLPLGLK